MRRTAALATLALAGAFAPDAKAARPMITDDARIVDPKACQVESWVRRNRDSTEMWALPACNPTGQLDLTFGGARVEEHGENAFTDNLVQATTIVQPLQRTCWRVGLAGGAAHHHNRERANDRTRDTHFPCPG